MTKTLITKKRAAALVIVLLILSLALPIANIMAANSSDGNVIIVLDPGHDADHRGSSANGIYEEVATLAIALACKEELEQYDGVTVYMTRDTESCPYEGTTSGKDNSKRVSYAASVSADAYVSLHLNAVNSATSTSACGVEIYYPNANYNTEVYEEGKGLAKSVLSKLVALGLSERGVKTRDSENNTLYEDDSLADYYTVIKESKENGFPGIIVEHAFLTNESDVANFLSTDEQLEALGVADATGIAEYYGLTKSGTTTDDSTSDDSSTDDTTTELSYENMKLKTKVVSTSAKGTKIKVIASNITGAENVKFRVEYSGDITQRTTRTATLSAKGNWYKNILMSKFTSAGTYNVTCYIYTNTQKIKAGTTTFTITEENSGENTVTDISDTRGEATVSASNLAITFGTKKVKIAVWPYGDKSKIKWYTITSADDSGNYSALMNIYDFEKFYGTYKVRTYVYSNSGKRLKLADTTFTISEPTPTVSITSNSSYSEFYYSGTGFAGTGYTIKKLTVKVWSKEDGKDDITTYVATLGDDGETWTLTIPIEDHTGTGTYYAYTYAAYNDGTAKTRIKKSTFDFPLTEILGTSEKTAEDFVTYYNTYSPISYPDYYATSDAPTIEDFAQIYIEEALTEGVRADVAFAQAMKETGFLKYGGQVDISQYNFAGLGALDGGASGASFETVRLGIRAQIQHLKAYATDEALVNTCVDPRYTYVTKGCAKYVEWLGIKENPYGKGWASATNYGFSLVSGYLEKI